LLVRSRVPESGDATFLTETRFEKARLFSREKNPQKWGGRKFSNRIVLNKSLRVTTQNDGYNVNFYALVPASISANPISPAASAQNGGVMFSFPTQMGFSYQAEYKKQPDGCQLDSIGNIDSRKQCRANGQRGIRERQILSG
jgi:hypothetical protein